MKDQQTPNSVVAPSAVGAAGMASALAAVVTSSFGVTGTIVGAAVTAMLVTAGSALLRTYMEGASGVLKTGAQRLRSGVNVPGRPDLANNLVGRMRAALGWFSQLPTAARRPVLIKGAIAAAAAFILAMGVVWAGERVIGNSLSCGFWGECPEGREPGIQNPALGGGGNGAGSTLTFARGNAPGSSGTTQDAADPSGGAQDVQQPNGSSGTQDPGGAVQTPNGGGSSGSGGSSGGGGVQNGGATPTPGTEEPVEETPTEEPPGEVSVPATPPEDPAAEEPVEPQSATPTE
jgi:hypothetical protein